MLKKIEGKIRNSHFLYNFMVKCWHTTFPFLRYFFIFSQKTKYTQFWSDSYFAQWDAIFKKYNFEKKAQLRYLEIGCFEGLSLNWMLKHVLTHRTARADVIDVFGPSYAFKFYNNLMSSKVPWKVNLYPGWSNHVLRRLKLNRYDIIYIDGSHSMADVFMDLALCWDLLKVDAIMILDDYLLGENVLPRDLRPKDTIDVFLNAFGGALELIHQGEQVIVRKNKTLIQGDIIFSFGDIHFDWYRKTIKNHFNQSVRLRETEVEIFENYIKKFDFSYQIPSNDSQLPADLKKIISTYREQNYL